MKKDNTNRKAVLNCIRKLTELQCDMAAILPPTQKFDVSVFNREGQLEVVVQLNVADYRHNRYIPVYERHIADYQTQVPYRERIRSIIKKIKLYSKKYEEGINREESGSPTA